MTGGPRPFWSRFVPDRIASQIAVLVFLSVASLHAVILVYVVWSRQGAPHSNPAETTGRVATLVQILDAAPAPARAELLTLLRAASPDLTLDMPAAAPAQPAERIDDPRAWHLRRLLGEDHAIQGPFSAEVDGRPSARLTVALRDGTPVTFILPLDRPPSPPGGGPLLVTIGFILVSLGLLGTWAVLALMKPLGALEATVEAYGPGRTARPLTETGPREIRTVARALNRMQERISRLMDDRSRTLAAVGHDLRTPITRLRLRAELLDDSPEKARMIADLDQMDALVQSALTHLRDGRGDEASSTLDLQSLLQTIADGYADLGKPVEMTASARPAIHGRPLELERAITNIIDNAIKYGGAAAIALLRDGDRAVIEVSDRGPGIPEAMRAVVLEPFVRGEAARTMNETDGFGLGLTIARSIIEAHDGTISFADGNPDGFVVRMSLPVA